MPFPLGQDVMADAIAGKHRVSVAGVFTPLQLTATAEFHEILTRSMQQRTQQSHAISQRTIGSDTAWAFWAATTQDLHQRRFSLIVTMMRRTGSNCADLHAELGQSGVADPAGGLLDAVAAHRRTNIGAVIDRLHPEAACEGGDERGICCRTIAQLMIKMPADQAESAMLGQSRQQGDTVDPAADRDDEGGAGSEISRDSQHAEVAINPAKRARPVRGRR